MSRRIRKHANPFQVRTRIGLVDRGAIFGREAELEVDLGCGSAAFIFERALAHPERDFIGLEVRLPLVDAAAGRREKDGPKNVWVFYANASENLELAKPGVIRLFHVHFPDPCFKKRHWKRRIVQPKTVRVMSTLLPIGGQIYAQSDVKPLAEEMYAFFAADGALEPQLDPSLCVDGPFPERTSWERQHETENERVYRMLFEKVREPVGAIPNLEMRATDPKRIS